jgi:hypothetical protein
MVKCGVCGDQAIESALLFVGAQKLIKNLCKRDLERLLENAKAGGGDRGRAQLEKPHLRVVPK